MAKRFTWNGTEFSASMRTLSQHFPEEFRQGMVARAKIVGATGDNHPTLLIEAMRPDLHAIVVLFARDVAER